MTKLALTAPLSAALPLKWYFTAASVGSGFQSLTSDLRVLKFPSSHGALQQEEEETQEVNSNKTKRLQRVP